MKHNCKNQNIEQIYVITVANRNLSGYLTSFCEIHLFNYLNSFQKKNNTFVSDEL